MCPLLAPCHTVKSCSNQQYVFAGYRYQHSFQPRTFHAGSAMSGDRQGGLTRQLDMEEKSRHPLPDMNKELTKEKTRERERERERTKERERESERERDLYVCISLYVSVCNCMYLCVYVEREGERER